MNKKQLATFALALISEVASAALKVVEERVPDDK